ncbi:helicase-related protein [Mongoliimonas terrestris]|uniref:helicase-related protein n=1 Tax=Mongoliimonas terrestris TaxID=1709001 RepID=UPI000949501F|nr:helicase-related protein [Mongoliimonas terrestris]
MTFSPHAPTPATARSRSVTAVLGPTNTGKTHLAIERMLGHDTGAIGLPLRLLAREVYTRVAARAGIGQVALITGEEKIVPPGARYFVSTVEAMPRDLVVSFVAIDEVQLAGDLERGHVFTDRILNVRGRSETLLLGSATARPLIEKLLPGVTVTSRPRLSQLVYTGSKKITRLPARSAVVAFSADEVYAIAELIRRQRGGAAVVMGALSPRTRNAQVRLFQDGDVDFLVATDAIGMGLNLDVDHVAFAQARKFDGYQYRGLTPSELGQIAGRAGRHLNDGTFGVTGRVQPFDEDLVQAIESHQFEPVRTFQWRNTALDFASVDALRASLDKPPGLEGLARALPSDDLRALEYALRDSAVKDAAVGALNVQLLWDACMVPDFRKISPAHHGDLIVALYRFLTGRGVIPDEWFGRQVSNCDRADGDIDALSARLADIRTWTYVANRPNWLADPVHWQERARQIEDRLSDALHERLTQRFVDRRTSVLMKRLRENAMLEAEITETGAVLVEGQHVGELHGFRFAPDQSASAEGPDGKAVRGAAAKALASEFEKRAERLSKAPNDDIVLASDGAMRWLGQPVAKLAAGDDALAPRVMLLADEQLTGPARDKAQARLDLWIGAHIQTLLKPLLDLKTAPDLEGIARGVAFRLVEALGTLERQEVAEDVKALDQTARAAMRKYGVRFGAYHIYVPALLKPAPAALVAHLWALKHGSMDMPGLAELPQLSASGRTSIKLDPAFDRTLYRLVGFRVAGERAVRLDILERLADIIRPLIAWKPVGDATPPDGAIPQGGGFTVTVAMTSLLGCSGEDFASILRGLGYRMEKRTVRVPVRTAPAPLEATAAVTGADAAVEAIAAPPADAAPLGADPLVTVDTDRTVPEPVLTDAPLSDVEPAVAAAADAAAQPDAPEPAVVESEPVDAEVALAGAPETAPVDPESETAASLADAVAETADAAAETSEDAASVADAPTTEAPASDEQPADTDATAAVAATAEPAVEEREVEVWRPGRFDRHRRPEARGGREQRGNRPEGQQRSEGNQRFERRHGGGGQGAGAQGGGQGAGGPGAGGQGGGGAGGGQGQRGPRGPQQSPREDRGPRRDDQRPERRDDRRPPQADRPRRPEKPVDPDSPFAALLALKADLEQKQKKK